MLPQIACTKWKGRNVASLGEKDVGFSLSKTWYLLIPNAQYKMYGVEEVPHRIFYAKRFHTFH